MFENQAIENSCNQSLISEHVCWPLQDRCELGSCLSACSSSCESCIRNLDSSYRCGLTGTRSFPNQICGVLDTDSSPETIVDETSKNRERNMEILVFFCIILIAVGYISYLVYTSCIKTPKANIADDEENGSDKHDHWMKFKKLSARTRSSFASMSLEQIDRDLAKNVQEVSTQ
jgi:hypothetical protein